MLDLVIREISHDREARLKAATIICGRFHPKSNGFAWDFNHDYFDSIRAEIILGSYVTGNLVGAGAAHVDPPGCSTRHDFLHIDALAVEEACGGLGIGSEMLMKFERLATLLGRNTISAFPLSDAENFYQQRGFAEDGQAFTKQIDLLMRD